MKSFDFSGGAARLLEDLVVAVSCAYLVVYVFIALGRVTYPFDLEWMEGGSVDHVRRLLAGEKIYSRPTLAFIAYVYPPLYYYVCAALARVTGLGLGTLRSVSFVSSIGCFVILFLHARREAGSLRAGLVAAGAFAAMYRIGGAWLDLARVDSLFLLQTLAALYLVRFGRSSGSWAAAGVLLATATLTKQTAALIGVPIGLYAIAVDWRRGVVLAAIGASVFGVATAVLQAINRGWYLYYVFVLPARLQQKGAESAPFWRHDMVAPLPVVWPLALVFLVLLVVRQRPAITFYLISAAAMIGSAWSSRLHSGAVENVLLPAYAILALLFGLAFSQLPELLLRPQWRTVVAGLCLVQLYLLRYDPSVLIPTAQDVEMEHHLMTTIAAVDGDVYLPQHGYFQTLVGKRANAQSWAVWDVLRTGGTASEQLADEIHGAIEDHRYRLIVLDKVESWFEPELSHSYHRVGRALDGDGLWTRTGYRTHPAGLYAPN